MNKFTILHKNKQIEIIIDSIKYIIGNDYYIKDIIEKTFINFFNKNVGSEYSKEHNYAHMVLFDEEPLNIKDFDFYYIDSNFDLETDIKLGSKSLCLAYLNSLLMNIEYNESFQTATILLQDIFDNIEIEYDCNIRPIFTIELVKKNLIKLLSIEFLKDDLVINNYDLDLFERIKLQLEMIKRISSTSCKRVIMILKLGFLDTKILNIIETIPGFKFIFFETTNVQNIKEVLLVNNDIFLDTLDENKLFELSNDYSLHLSLEEFKNKILSNYLNEKVI